MARKQKKGDLTPRQWGWILCLLLLITTVAGYWQVRQFDFTLYDDQEYVTENAMVLKGITPETIRWAMTTTHFSYWHPLTWLSHMLDIELFGLNAGWHHVTNVLIHILASWALLFALARLTGSMAASAFVAFLFALHPLHVESVAWVAERKDVLSTLFWFLTLWAYTWYCEKPGMGRYLLALFLFALGLMSKPMLVTVPCVMLLLDLWPLKRLKLIPDKGKWFPKKGLVGWWKTIGRLSKPGPIRLVLEKVPFLVLAIISSAITFIGVYTQDRMLGTETVSIGLRLANVPISYVRYLGKMVWPENMVVLYPMPESWPVWMVAGSLVLLILITVGAVLLLRRAPYLLVGWLWYLGTLVPTIGIIPVGWHSIADRYTYVPLVGIFIMIAWGIRDLTAGWAAVPRRATLVTASAAIILGCTLGTWNQSKVWRNSETLFRQAAEAVEGNYLALYNLALSLQMQQRYDEALRHYEESIRINPGRGKAHNNIGVMYNAVGQYDKATNYLFQCININPDFKRAYLNLGYSMVSLGNYDLAKRHYDRALELDPGFGEVYAQMGWLAGKEGDLRSVLAYYRKAVQLNPRLVGITAQLAWLLATLPQDSLRNGQEAVTLAQQACNGTPHPPAKALLALAAAQAEVGQFEEALQSLSIALDAASRQGQVALMNKAGTMEKQFQSNTPFREPYQEQ